MPQVSLSTNGSVVIIPGVYPSIFLSPVVPLQVPTGPLVFIAAGYGGVPFTPTNYTDPNSLIAAMRGAPSASYVNFLFNPSDELNGASLVTYINAAPNTQSFSNMISSGAVTVIQATSEDYGTPSNLLQYSIFNGSIGGKYVTLLDGFSGHSVYQDNLGLPFQLSYLGSSNLVVYSVVSTIAGQATSLVISSPNLGESVTVDLTSSTYATISQVVQYLNGTGYYTANVISNGFLPSYYLDIVASASLPAASHAVLATTIAAHGFSPGQSVTISGVNIGAYNVTAVIAAVPSTTTFVYSISGTSVSPGSGGTALVASVGSISLTSTTQPNVAQSVNITATLGDIVNFINTSNPQLATAVIATGITSNPGNAPANIGLGYFSGATNGVPSFLNYVNALNVSLSIPAWVIFMDSTQSSVRNSGAQAVVEAGTPLYRSWRRYVTGSALGESYSTAITNAVALNAYQVTYCWPGIQYPNPTTGSLGTLSGLYTAACVAGMMCGNSVPTPLTNKTIIGAGVEQVTTLANMISLQNSGVMVLNYPNNTKVPTFLSDVTTWQNDSNPANVYNQQVACRFALQYYLVNQLQPYVGTIESPINLTQARSAVINLLNAIIYTGNNSIGILSSWDPTTLVLTYDGTTQALTVAVSVVFVGQVRFIPVAVTVNPLNLSINAQGTVTQT